MLYYSLIIMYMNRWYFNFTHDKHIFIFFKSVGNDHIGVYICFDSLELDFESAVINFFFGFIIAISH